MRYCDHYERHVSRRAPVPTNGRSEPLSRVLFNERSLSVDQRILLTKPECTSMNYFEEKNHADVSSTLTDDRFLDGFPGHFVGQLNRA